MRVLDRSSIYGDRYERTKYRDEGPPSALRFFRATLASATSCMRYTPVSALVVAKIAITELVDIG